MSDTVAVVAIVGVVAIVALMTKSRTVLKWMGLTWEVGPCEEEKGESAAE